MRWPRNWNPPSAEPVCALHRRMQTWCLSSPAEFCLGALPSSTVGSKRIVNLCKADAGWSGGGVPEVWERRRSKASIPFVRRAPRA